MSRFVQGLNGSEIEWPEISTFWMDSSPVVGSAVAARQRYSAMAVHSEGSDGIQSGAQLY